MGSEELADNILKLLKLMEAGNCYREEIIKGFRHPFEGQILTYDEFISNN